MNQNTTYFLKTKLVKLRPVLESDLETIYHWYNSKDLQKTTSHHRYPNTIEKQRKLYLDHSQDSSHMQLAVVKDEKLVGTITLFHINHLDQKAEISVHIFDSSKQKTKVAIHATALVLDHAFTSLNLNKIYAGLMTGLEGWGAMLCDFFGFVKEGVKRQDVYKEGKFMDIHLFSLLKKEYFNAKKINNILD